MLPKSYIISEGLSRTGGKDFASGGFANIWKGKLIERDSNPRSPRMVCIKAIKITARSGEAERNDIEKVCNSPSVPPDSFT